MNNERERIFTLLENKSMTDAVRNKHILRFFDIQQEITEEEYRALSKVVKLPSLIHFNDYRVNAAFKWKVCVKNDELLKNLIISLEKIIPDVTRQYLKAFLYVYMSINGNCTDELLSIFSYERRFTDADITNLNNFFMLYKWSEEIITELYKRGADIAGMYLALANTDHWYWGQTQFKPEWVKVQHSHNNVKHTQLPKLPTVYHIDKTLFSAERGWTSNDKSNS